MGGEGNSGVEGGGDYTVDVGAPVTFLKIRTVWQENMTVEAVWGEKG